MSFADFWSVYPRRKGANPRFPAEKKYLAALKSGAEEAHLISSAKRYAEELAAQGKIGTEFVCMAQTWLHQRRWLDYAPSAEVSAEKEMAVAAFMAAKGYVWNGERWYKPDTL